MGDLSLVSGGNNVKLWRTDSSRLILVDRSIYNGETSSLCWSADNQYLAGCSSPSGQIIIRNLSNTETYVDEECLGMSCVSFDHSNNLLVGGRNGLIRTWDVKGRKFKNTYEGIKVCVTALQHSQSDSTFAAGFDNGNVSIYRKMMGAFYSIPSPNKLRISCLRFSNFYKNILSSSSDDGSICIFDVKQKQLCHSFPNVHSAPINCLTFSPVNKNFMMSVGLDKKIFFYDISNKRVLNSKCFDEKPMSIDVHCNGCTVVVGMSSGQIRFYDLRQQMHAFMTEHAHTSPVNSLRFESKFNENKSQPNIRTIEEVPLPDPEDNHPSGVLKNASASIDRNDDIFSPFRSEGIESSKRDSKQSIDGILTDSIISEPSIHAATSTIFSPLAASSAIRQPKLDFNTPCKIDSSFTQIFGNTPSLHQSGAPLKELDSLLNPPEDIINRDVNAKSIELCAKMSLENLKNKFDDNLVGAAGTTSPLDSLPIELLRKVVREEVQDCFEQLHKGFLNLHVEMIKKFHEQQLVLQHLLQSSIHEPQLLNEIKQLREENALLKKRFQ